MENISDAPVLIILHQSIGIFLHKIEVIQDGVVLEEKKIKTRIGTDSWGFVEVSSLLAKYQKMGFRVGQVSSTNFSTFSWFYKQVQYVLQK